MNILTNLLNPPKLNDVFTPGGQPSITYNNRAHLNLEPALKKAIALATTIVSLTGATKAGKTVLCKSVMEAFEYVWIDGGQIKTESDLWTKICSELRLPAEQCDAEGRERGVDGGIKAEGSAGFLGTGGKIEVSLGGSRLKSFDSSRTYKIDGMSSAIEHLLKNNITLIIDDFHYLTDDVRADVIKSLKGAVFKGLKVVLLSTPYRAFEAIKAEPEVTGRFKHVTVPDWSEADLIEIGQTGFKALNVDCPTAIIELFAKESQGSPLLMQQFCWNLCYDCGIEEANVTKQVVPANFDTDSIFREVASDAGLPVYEKLKKGPQTRTERIPRPLVGGGTADIYQAILLSIAATGPKEKLTYDQIRSSLNTILADKVPQKLEVSNALNHLSSIDAGGNRGSRALDWNSDDLELVLVDPFFRFYLRWEVHRAAK
ncbi:AAA family ATPase [Rhizorhabdus phycosphaerae]|uniref:AAA family ATPase n=1 Tax=Rhizorhabdus phycosphaerae TaxID=2711156 RepID=UPI0013EB0961|nr:AAA family ATPase [Rhizorhabdus phycosphaerae]